MSRPGALRLDRWLWHARFVRSRDAVEELVGLRRVRVNNQIVAKTHTLVRPGDVVMVSHPSQVRVMRVRDLGSRRGPASEAAGLYEELATIE